MNRGRYLEELTIPIVPGLKILTKPSHVSLVPRRSASTCRAALADGSGAPTMGRFAPGVEWAYRQTVDLFERGVPSVHFYVMQNTGPSSQ
jgi:methylenetetrahydrofolate reductase (NADH)